MAESVQFVYTLMLIPFLLLGIDIIRVLNGAEKTIPQIIGEKVIGGKK